MVSQFQIPPCVRIDLKTMYSFLSINVMRSTIIQQYGHDYINDTTIFYMIFKIVSWAFALNLNSNYDGHDTD